MGVLRPLTPYGSLQLEQIQAFARQWFPGETSDIFEYMERRMGATGTHIFISHLKQRTSLFGNSGNPSLSELYGDYEFKDIVSTDYSVTERCSSSRSNRIEHSLRRYLENLYLRKPRLLNVRLLGEKVNMENAYSRICCRKSANRAVRKSAKPRVNEAPTEKLAEGIGAEIAEVDEGRT